MKNARFYAIVLAFILATGGAAAFQAAAQAPKRAASNYIVLAWNDLGMHCYNRDFQDLAVLPPYNTLWAQVLRVGNPPQVVTSGVTVSYLFADNTTSAGKSNFWQYAQALFGVNLAPNIGLTGRGLSGEMDLAGDHFVVEGIPLTEYSDSRRMRIRLTPASGARATNDAPSVVRLTLTTRLSLAQRARCTRPFVSRPSTISEVVLSVMWR